MPIDILQAFETKQPDPDFLWPGFLAGTVGALVAPGATGKSFWALQAAMAVACHVPGGDLLGLNPSQNGKRQTDADLLQNRDWQRRTE